ncbi:MAG: hypothetical protein K0S51_1165 [Bacillales bacterium]|jgi:hypothetical protein|nr:hypothetical protein [Bacillales bacterium]
MKKALKFIVLFTTFFVLYVGFFDKPSLVNYAFWKYKWGLDVPYSNKINTVFQSNGMNYAAYHIVSYDNKLTHLALRFSEWNKISGNERDFINEKISNIKQDKEDVFTRHPILFDENSYYIFLDKSSSYNAEIFFAILNPKTKKMYIYEYWGI